MILVFGGSFQGKLEFAKSKFNIEDKDVCNLENENLDLTKKVLSHFEIYIRKEEYTLENIKRDLDLFKNKIIIANDETLGLVPIEPKDREYRENLGRVLTYISLNSNEVYRVFLGLGEKLK